MSIAPARQHLEATVSDYTARGQEHATRITWIEIIAIRELLEELHRLHTVVATQEKTLRAIAAQKKGSHRGAHKGNHPRTSKEQKK